MSRERGRATTTTTAERIKNFSHTTRSQPVSNIELNGAASCGSSVPTARRGPSTPTLGARRRPGARAPPASRRPPYRPLVELPKRSGGEAGQKNGGNEKKKKPKEENKTKRNGTEKKHIHTLTGALSRPLTHPHPPHTSPLRPTPTRCCRSTPNAALLYMYIPTACVYISIASVSIYIYICIGIFRCIYPIPYAWHIEKETLLLYSERFFVYTYAFFHFFTQLPKKQNRLARYLYYIPIFISYNMGSYLFYIYICI